MPPRPPERHAGEPPVAMAAATDVAAFDDDPTKLAPPSVATMAITRQAQTKKKTNASSRSSLPQHSKSPDDLSGLAPI
jgi:hypothetical protein